MAPRTHDNADARLSRRQALAYLGAAGLWVAGASQVLAACGGGKSQARGRNRRPNVLLVVVDDMRYDQLPYMPNTRRLILDEGTAFTQARCNVPLCQPSRVGFLTGQTSRHNHEYTVGFKGTALTNHDNALGNWMKEAGYRCGLFGKYINFVDGLFGGIDAPAGYDTWREMSSEDDAYHFTVHLERSLIKVAGQYPTDYLAAESSKFVAGSEPFFCILTPREAHAPYTPRKDLARKWANVDWPIVDEVDVSDKPPWIRALPPLTDADKAKIRRDVRGALRELSAVDDMIEKVLTHMSGDMLANTVVIFTSDNGVHDGEHRRLGDATKAGPYDVGLHVPMLVRGPGFPRGAVVTAPSLAMQDITATILAVGGGQAGLPYQAGTSLTELAANPVRYSQRVLLHEIGEGFESQTGEGVTTGPDHHLGFRKLYRYPSVRVSRDGPFIYEAYDLDTDPDELQNWADDPARRGERDTLEAQLEMLLRA